MTFPAVSFAPVAPPADGLALAFRSARRRRNSKAAVSAFGAAVAVSAVLSFLAPPGQTLLQQPLPPAGGGGLVPGLPLAPAKPVAPAASRPAAAVPTSPVLVRPAHPSQLVVGHRPAPAPAVVVTFSALQVRRPLSCQAQTGPYCAGVTTSRDRGRTSAQATFCPSQASARASYSVPDVKDAGTVEVATRSCS